MVRGKPRAFHPSLAPYAEDTHQYKVDVATFWLLELEDLNSSFPGYYMEMWADANLGRSLSL